MRERNRGPKLGLSFDGGRFDEPGVAVDAGLNARRSGEAFGLSIAEFLSDKRQALILRIRRDLASPFLRGGAGGRGSSGWRRT
jgi:hypothetical protein